MVETTSFIIKEIPTDLWTKFKDLIPRTITLEDALITLIKEKVKNG